MLSKEREQAIRRAADGTWLGNAAEFACDELLAEIDAMRAERKGAVIVAASSDDVDALELLHVHGGLGNTPESFDRGLDALVRAVILDRGELVAWLREVDVVREIVGAVACMVAVVDGPMPSKDDLRIAWETATDAHDRLEAAPPAIRDLLSDATAQAARLQGGR